MAYYHNISRHGNQQPYNVCQHKTLFNINMKLYCNSAESDLDDLYICLLRNRFPNALALREMAYNALLYKSRYSLNCEQIIFKHSNERLRFHLTEQFRVYNCHIINNANINATNYSTKRHLASRDSSLHKHRKRRKTFSEKQTAHVSS